MAKENLDKIELVENGSEVEKKEPELVNENPIPQSKVDKVIASINGVPDKTPSDVKVKKPALKGGPPKIVVSDEVVPKTKRGRGRPKKSADKPIQLFTGDTLLFLTDVVVPRVAALANNHLIATSPEDKIDWTELRLDPSEKAELKLIAEEAAQKIGLTADPITLYAITTLSLYAMKMLLR